MELNPIIIHFSIRLKNVIFPINSLTFQNNLTTSGFLLAQPGTVLPNNLVTTPNDIAIRRNTVVSLNTQKMVVGVAGTNPLEILETFTNLEPILTNSGMNTEDDIRFYELLAEYNIASENNPVKKIQNFFGPLSSISKFDEVMGSDSSLFTIRIVPKDVVIDQENYYEARIEPLVVQQDSTYYFYLIFRNKERAIVEDFTRNLNNKISSLVEIIESDKN